MTRRDVSAKPAVRRSQRERSEATRGELLAAARKLFASRGFAATSLETVVSICGVTKGALYHHFDGKRDLFRAVFEEEQRRLATIVAEAYTHKADPWSGFIAGCRAFLGEALDPRCSRSSSSTLPASSAGRSCTSSRPITASR